MNELYPIGTIVLLQNSTKRILIIGYLPQEYNGSTIYDYSGVPFPEGMIDSRKILLFNHVQIDKVCHESIKDEETANFMKQVKKIKENG